MLGPSGLAPLALHQLAAWQRLAATWPLVLAERELPSPEHPMLPGKIQLHLTCTWCERSLLTLHDGAAGYVITPQHVTDATVRHLRACHPDQEPAGL